MGLGGFAAGIGAAGMGVSSLGDWIKDKLNEIYEYSKCWYVVDHSEEAVILFCGKYNRTLKPGLHFKIPILEVGTSVHVKPDTMEIESICITTSDGKTIMLGLAFNYKVINTKKFLYENTDSPSNMKDMARAELSDYMEDREWNDIRKKTTKNAIQKNLQKYFDTLGVEIIDLKFTTKAQTRVFKIFSEENKHKAPQDAFI